MLELLRSLEWQAGYNGHACPSCRACEVDGHTPTCTLAAAIRGLEAPGFKGRQPGERVEALTPYGWQDAEVVRIEGSGAVRVETDSAATWVVSLGDVRRKGEPTVDEMAAEMGWTRAADLNRGEHSWIDPTTGAVRLSRRWGPDWDLRAGWSAFEDSRGWATDEMAIRTLYREHKARQGDPPDEELERALGRSVTKEEEPPTDPTALAAWLYARVVPGQTAVEYRTAAGIVGKSLVARCYAGTDRVAIGIYGGETVLVPGQGSTLLTFTRLLNPDGSVLWEAK